MAELEAPRPPEGRWERVDGKAQWFTPTEEEWEQFIAAKEAFFSKAMFEAAYDGGHV